MANRRLPMRKIKEVLRLKFECHLSEREIARSCQISRTTVTDYLRRATIARLNWAEAAALGEVQLMSVFSRCCRQLAKPDDQPASGAGLSIHLRSTADLPQIQSDSDPAVDGVQRSHPDGYQYSQFCDHYRRWRGKLDY